MKQIVALLTTAVALLLIYLSAYLPYVKGDLYITALQDSGQAKTLQDFLQPFENAITFWSPVGDPEIIRFFGNNVLSMITDQKQAFPESVATPLVNYTVDELNSSPLGSKGLNYSQDILIEASILSNYGEKYKKLDALQKAEELYKEGLILSPNRPQFLYGLFALYTAEGRSEEAKSIGETILKYWPTDQSVSSVINQLNGTK